MDLRDVAESISRQRGDGPFSDIAGRAHELAQSVPAEHREAVGLAMITVGLCLSDLNGRGVNILGLVAAELLEPAEAGRR